MLTAADDDDGTVPSKKEDAECGGCGICGTVGVVDEPNVLLTAPDEFGIFGYGSLGVVVVVGMLTGAAAVPSKKDETEFGG